MSRILFTDVTVLDGTGAAPFPGEVLVEGNKIVKIAKGAEHIDPACAQVMPCDGLTLMPGLCDCHTHLTWAFSDTRVPRNVENFLRNPPVPERLALICAHNAKTMLEHGYTMAYSAGAITQTMEVALRDEIEEGWIPGPRFIPSGTEGVRDEYVSTKQERKLSRSQDVEGVRHYIRHTAEIGAKIAKFIMSGPGIAFGEEFMTMYTDEQLAAAQDEAQKCNVWLSSHARPAVAVKQSLKFGFRVIYHCDDVDEEALDMMEARKDEIFIGPSVAFSAVGYERAKTDEEKARMKYRLDHYKNNAKSMLKRGIRVMPGGDYGFAPIPHGHNACDLDYFVRYLDFTPMQAIVSATKWGGEIMGRPEELGLIKEGYLADLLLVAGDPLKNIRQLADKENLLMIMKDGQYYKAPQLDRVPAHEAAE